MHSMQMWWFVLLLINCELNISVILYAFISNNDIYI